MNLPKYIIISIVIHLAAGAFLLFAVVINDDFLLSMKNGRSASPDRSYNSNDGDEKNHSDSLKQIIVEFFSFNESVSARSNKLKGGSYSSPDAGALNHMVETAYKNNPPEYPTIAKKMGYQGVVSLELEILPDGSCGNVQIARSSGYSILDTAAVKAAKSWVFFKNYSILLLTPVKVRQDVQFILTSY